MRSSRARLAATPVALVAALAAGCASPEFTYVHDGDGRTYFKVPAVWRQIDQKALDAVLERSDPESATAQVRKQLVWSIAYDAHAQPAVQHLYGLGTSDEPFVFARVAKLLPSELDGLSLNGMRDVILPVSEEVRARAEQIPGYPLTGFELLADEVLHPGDGVRGVHVRFNYAVQGAGVQTFDLTSYLSEDGQRLSTMLVRCSAACYRERAAELDRITQSFKVKRAIG
ncbi:hypothetical protein [Planomonospora parontospora]|uniref:hypothetical protein n=1 Tax=Planomonospora parontospora TaxID=58119 RepID=UPI00177AF700|nr:hypothetical protein [Planomonospora parontospora]